MRQAGANLQVLQINDPSANEIPSVKSSYGEVKVIPGDPIEGQYNLFLLFDGSKVPDDIPSFIGNQYMLSPNTTAQLTALKLTMQELQVRVPQRIAEGFQIWGIVEYCIAAIENTEIKIRASLGEY